MNPIVNPSFVLRASASHDLAPPHAPAEAGAAVRWSITCQTSLSSWFSFQMPRAPPSSTGGPATSPIAPLTAASTHSWPPRPMLSWPGPGGEDHGQRVGDPEQVAPQALLARLHHRAVPAGAEHLRLEPLRTEVVGHRAGELAGRDGGAVDPLDVQRRHLAGRCVFALLCGHLRSLRP